MNSSLYRICFYRAAHYLKRLLLIGCCLLFFLPSFAQELLLTSKAISVEEGLSSRDIGYAYEDSYGFIWVATQSGLNRFDGYKTKTLTEKDGLQAHKVYQVYGTSDSMLLVDYRSKAIDVINPLTCSVTKFDQYFKGRLPFSVEDIVSTYHSVESRTIYIKTTDRQCYQYLGHKQWVKVPLPASVAVNGELKFILFSDRLGTHIHLDSIFYRKAPHATSFSSYSLKPGFRVLGLTKEGTPIFFKENTQYFQFYQLQDNEIVPLTDSIPLATIEGTFRISGGNYTDLQWYSTSTQTFWIKSKDTYVFKGKYLYPRLFFTQSVLPPGTVFDRVYSACFTNNDKILVSQDKLYIIQLVENYFTQIPSEINSEI